MERSNYLINCAPKIERMVEQYRQIICLNFVCLPTSITNFAEHEIGYPTTS
jgi:hypothetical protein